MSNFSEALAGAARSGLCQVLAVPEYINDTLERVGFFPFDEARRAVPDFWRNLLCDTPAPDPNPSPFTGGQCSALYTVQGAVRTYSPTQCIAATTPFNFGNYWGPIESVGIERAGTGQQGKLYNFRFVNYGNGSFPMSIPQTTSLFVGGSGESCPDVTLLSFNPIRVDGLPDNCGNPDPEYRDLEPEDVTVNTAITYQNSLGVEVTIPVTLIYARAQVLALGDVIIPFTLQLSPTVAFNGSVSLGGTVNIYTAPTGPGTTPKDPRKSPCDDIPLPDGEVPEDPTDSDQDPEPDRNSQKVIKGVLVTVNSVENIRASVITQDENPDIYAPSLGFVNFLVRVGTISAGWTTDIPVKNRRHLIQCPWDEGALEVRGTPQPGVVWTLTPVFGYAGRPVEYVQ